MGVKPAIQQIVMLWYATISQSFLDSNLAQSAQNKVNINSTKKELPVAARPTLFGRALEFRNPSPHTLPQGHRHPNQQILLLAVPAEHCAIRRQEHRKIRRPISCQVDGDDGYHMPAGSVGLVQRQLQVEG